MHGSKLAGVSSVASRGHELTNAGHEHSGMGQGVQMHIYLYRASFALHIVKDEIGTGLPFGADATCTVTTSTPRVHTSTPATTVSSLPLRKNNLASM